MSKQPELFQPGKYVKPTIPLVKKPLPDLTEEEKEIVAVNRAAVHSLGNDAVDFVGELHKVGLINGWRSVAGVELFKEGK